MSDIMIPPPWVSAGLEKWRWRPGILPGPTPG